ncbi:MAG: TorF family putative porin [Gemmatimonadota bacterium]|nr:TorF family putative porin [Gemmatimonadota bacterium]
MMKPLIVAVFLLSLSLPSRAVSQEVDMTANVGWVSEYLYRGIPQNTSSASMGLDLAVGPVYLGTWAADVGEGAEVDLYGGVGIDVHGLALSAGGTGYLYTGEFDDTYAEGNFGAAYGPVSVDFAVGRYLTDPETLDYTFLVVGGEVRGWYANLGRFDGDFDGMYGELGYGFTVSEIDFTVGWVLSDAELALLPSGRSNATLVLGLSRVFTLR